MYVMNEAEGGKWFKDGYVVQYVPDHPNASGGYVYEHRLVMEKVLGRYLTPEESVHHRNGVKWDNEPSNLELWIQGQPAGQRAKDQVAWAQKIIRDYGGFVMPEPRADLIRVGVDLDGTLAEAVWTPESPGREIGRPLWHNVEKVKQLVEMGYKIWIWTARPDTDYELIEQWLLYWEIPFHGIRTGKPLFVAVFDDRAYHSETNWIEVLDGRV